MTAGPSVTLDENLRGFRNLEAISSILDQAEGQDSSMFDFATHYENFVELTAYA